MTGIEYTQRGYSTLASLGLLLLIVTLGCADPTEKLQALDASLLSDKEVAPPQWWQPFGLGADRRQAEDIQTIVFAGSQELTAETLQPLQALTGLRKAYFKDSGITDSGLRHLAGLTVTGRQRHFWRHYEVLA